MAAITNQEKAWKHAWMQRLEKITDVWDIVKAACGRSAEVVLSFCMFAQLIGVLPGVHYWPWADNFILAVQVIMLDMGAFALHTLAEQARENGHEDAAEKADKLGTFLIRLMITTIALIIIGQVSPIFGAYGSLIKVIVGYIELALILVRVVSTVRFIHVIHSLRGSTLSVQSVAPQETDYAAVAAHLLPLLRNDLQALIPAQPVMDVQGFEARIITIIEEKVTTLLPVASGQIEDRFVDSDMSPQMSTLETPIRESVCTKPSPKTTVKLSTQSSPKTSTGDAQKRAARVLKKHPDIGPTELANKAQISRSYASKILAAAKGDEHAS